MILGNFYFVYSFSSKMWSILQELSKEYKDIKMFRHKLSQD